MKRETHTHTGWWLEEHKAGDSVSGSLTPRTPAKRRFNMWPDGFLAVCLACALIFTVATLAGV